MHAAQTARVAAGGCAAGAEAREVWAALETRSRQAYSFAFHPTRELVAFGHGDGLVNVFTTDGAFVDKAVLLDGAITCVAFSDDGHRFVVGDEHGRVAVGTIRSA